jgi:mannose-6-phosphate isomerase-like protein (cupin superfamily)
MVKRFSGSIAVLSIRRPRRSKTDRNELHMGGLKMRFETRHIAGAPDAIAPDGSEVRVLCRLPRGSLAVFTLPPNAVSKAIAHRTVEELWYVVSGCGRIWRKLGQQEEIVEIGPGASVSIPVGTHFQFRCDGAEPLSILDATMPPWPGESEAYTVEGEWSATR